MTKLRPRGGAARILRAVERVLLVLACVLLGYYAAVQVSTALYQSASARELDRVRAPIGERRAAPAPLAEGSLIGRIQVPRLGISAIVNEGDGEKILRRAVGHIPGTALPGAAGNAGLAGHRDTFFRKLKNVRTGDRIVVTMPGNVSEYVVKDTHVVGPEEVSVLRPTGGHVLTLVTCYPFNYIGAAPNRFIVHAELVE